MNNELVSEKFDQAWRDLWMLDAETEGWTDLPCESKVPFRIASRVVPGSAIPMIRSCCTFTQIPADILFRALQVENRTLWDDATFCPLEDYDDETKCTHAIYKGAGLVDDRDFVDLARVKVTRSFIATVNIDALGIVCASAPRSDITRALMMTCGNVIRAEPQRGAVGEHGTGRDGAAAPDVMAPGCTIVMFSHVDLKLNALCEKIGQNLAPSRLAQWFRRLRKGCLKIMREGGMAIPSRTHSSALSPRAGDSPDSSVASADIIHYNDTHVLHDNENWPQNDGAKDGHNDMKDGQLLLLSAGKESEFPTAGPDIPLLRGCQPTRSIRSCNPSCTVC